MGGAAAAAADVSSEGTLVWVRRPNGSWWPGRVISPLHVPHGCPAPPNPRSTATPIMLLGRRNGPALVDWCNLERTKRVKPFRCGEFDFDHRITKAQDQAARRRPGKRTYTNKGRYSCKEDAILQALRIESSSSTLRDATATTPKRKRKTPYDSDDDAPQGFRRMRDLTDIGFSTAPNPVPNAAALSHYSLHLPCTKRNRHSHPATNNKHTFAHQDQPCRGFRKKDRSRPLSELCNGDAPNGFKPSEQNDDGHSLDMASCSASSSGTSSLHTALLDNSSPHYRGVHKTGISCMAGSHSDYFPHTHRDNFLDTPCSGGRITQADHLQTYQLCASTKYPISKCNSQGTVDSNASKEDISSRYNDRKIKKKTTSSVGHEGNSSSRTGNALECEHRKARTVKYKSQSNEVVVSEEKVNMSSLSKRAEAGDNKELVISPTDLDCVGAVLQHCSETKHERDLSSGTISSHSNCENVSASSLAFELPLQVLPPEHKVPKPASWRAAKPTKSLHLDSALYEVDLSVQGSNNMGPRVPLVSLMSRWNTRPVVGYPVSVEVLDDVCSFPASSLDDHHPAASSGNGLLNKVDPPVVRYLRSSSHMDHEEPKSHRKTLEHEMDRLWRPHTKKPVSSSRKMRRLSSFATGERGGEGRKSVVGEMSEPAIACIPLRVVFSRITEALGYPVK